MFNDKDSQARLLMRRCSVLILLREDPAVSAALRASETLNSGLLCRMAKDGLLH
jgi:hypothetical protein